MPRKLFDQELSRLNADLAEMGRQVDDLMQKTLRCLRTMDVNLAASIFPHDAEFNSMERGIEQNCLSLLALQQPLAHDLRHITAALKIITDLERVADQCADICEILGTVAGISQLRPTSQLLVMMEKARHMLSGALDAFLREDTARAEVICKADDEVDSLFSSVVLELCGRITDEQRSDVPGMVDFLFITKYVERMADHATNIAEWAIFVRTGEHPDLNHADEAKELDKQQDATL